MTMFREDYVPILLTAVIKNGVTVRLGENVVNVDEASTTVVLGSGEVLHADLIVGADGEPESHQTLDLYPSNMLTSRYTLHHTQGSDLRRRSTHTKSSECLHQPYPKIYHRSNARIRTTSQRKRYVAWSGSNCTWHSHRRLV